MSRYNDQEDCEKAAVYSGLLQSHRDRSAIATV